MKNKLVKRVIALALSFTLALAMFAPMTVMANDDVVFQLATDDFIQGLAVGTALPRGYDIWEGTNFFAVGPSDYSIVESPFGGNGIRIGNRRDAWQGIDMRTNNFGMTDGQYTIRVQGHIRGAAGMQLGGGDSPWTGFFGESISGDFRIEHTFTLAGVAENGVAERGFLRINTTSNLTDLTIYEIVIVRGTSIPADLPVWEGERAAAAEETEEYEEEAEEYEEEAEEYEEEAEEYEEEEAEEYEEIEPIIEIAPQGVTIQLTIDSTTMVVNGQNESLDVAPFIDVEANRTMVPFRAIGNAMGAEVDFEDGVASYELGGRRLEVVLGQEVAPGMGTAENIDGRVLVPVRFVTEFFGAELEVALPSITITLY